jgi:adenosylcobyric acid synthase
VTHEYTLLVDGTVLPGGDTPPADAIAWTHDTILALGSTEAIDAISRGDSSRLDLHGAFVVPLDPGTTLDVGGSADLRIVDRDPRIHGSVPRTLAVVRNGRAVEGSLRARRPIMLMGCTSDAGKSFLTTALCRIFADRGLRVAPFKAQNMSNNAAVTPDGAEIGRAQHLQATAAGVIPEARHNPILLKPSTDTMSQVIVMGRFDAEMTAAPWMGRSDRLWPVVEQALNGLLAENDLLIIEGAGSPAEINLRATDIVNMRVALAANADVYLVADIDRGGAFAHLLGTWLCLAPEEQALVRGFVLNRFRGDPALLGNAMDRLEERTGVPTVAIVPMLRHHLPEEDAFHHRASPVPGDVNLALVLYPYASNLDEWDPLLHEPGVTVTPIRDRRDLREFDAVLLPGSKNTAASLRYLRDTGLADELMGTAAAGRPIVGVCGGLQLLGARIEDPLGLEGGDVDGLGLLDISTTLAADKTTRETTVAWRGIPLRGYEIRHGRTAAGPKAAEHLPDGLGWEQGTVRGVYVHDLFANTAYRQAFLDGLGWRGTARDWAAHLDAEIDRETAAVAEAWHLL